MHSLRFYCGLLSFDWIVVNYENRSFTAYPHSIVCDAFGFHRASRGFEFCAGAELVDCESGTSWVSP